MVELAESLIRPMWSAIVTRVPWFELAVIFRALHGKFTAVVYRGFYRGKAYHRYTVVASYHIPYRLTIVQCSENRTISTIYHFVR